jgi:hypothetical protein
MPGTGIEPVRGKPPQDFNRCYHAARCKLLQRDTKMAWPSTCAMLRSVSLRFRPVRERLGKLWEGEHEPETVHAALCSGADASCSRPTGARQAVVVEPSGVNPAQWITPLLLSTKLTTRSSRSTTERPWRWRGARALRTQFQFAKSPNVDWRAYSQARRPTVRSDDDARWWSGFACWHFSASSLETPARYFPKR